MVGEVAGGCDDGDSVGDMVGGVAATSPEVGCGVGGVDSTKLMEGDRVGSGVGSIVAAIMTVGDGVEAAAVGPEIGTAVV